MDAITETFNLLSTLIQEIAEDMERLVERATAIPLLPPDQLSTITDEMLILGEQHDSLIPHWMDLRNIMYMERIKNGQA